MSSVPYLYFPEMFILQFVMVFMMTLLMFSRNLYYSLLYLFMQIMLMGLLISLYGVEVLTGLLFVVECTIMLISMIMLIYLQVDGFSKMSFLSVLNWQSVLFFIGLCSMLYLYVPMATSEQLYSMIEYVMLWDNYYESIYITMNNDFSGLFVLYYQCGSMHLILFVLLLWLVSIMAVMIFKGFYQVRFKLFNTMKLIELREIYTHYNFLSQQDLMCQTRMTASTSLMSKQA